MPILVMALVAFTIFLAIGGLLFAAGISERRLLSHAEHPAHAPRRTV